MNTETAFARMLPTVEPISKAVVNQVAQQSTPPTLSALGEQTHLARSQIDQ